MNMNYTIEVRTMRFGVWHLSSVVLASSSEAAEFIEELTSQWPGLVSEWRVIETWQDPTHSWTKEFGLTPCVRRES